MSDLSGDPPVQVDFLETGSSGPVVLPVHSSVSSARQWRGLMDDLKDRFRVRAVNLFGYAKTPPRPNEVRQSLDDQARLVEAALPADADEDYMVGHSFGGSVAMKAAARLQGRVGKVVLLETNPFYLLAQSGRTDAFAEAMAMRNCIKNFGALGQWDSGRTICRLLGRRRIVGGHAAGPTGCIRAGAEAEFLRVGRRDRRNDAAGRMGAVAAAPNTRGERSEHGAADPRDRGAAARLLSDLDLSGGHRRSHGAADTARRDQSSRDVVLAIACRLNAQANWRGCI